MEYACGTELYLWKKGFSARLEIQSPLRKGVTFRKGVNSQPNFTNTTEVVQYPINNIIKMM